MKKLRSLLAPVPHSVAGAAFAVESAWAANITLPSADCFNVWGSADPATNRAIFERFTRPARCQVAQADRHLPITPFHQRCRGPDCRGVTLGEPAIFLFALYALMMMTVGGILVWFVRNESE